RVTGIKQGVFCFPQTLVLSLVPALFGYSNQAFLAKAVVSTSPYKWCLRVGSSRRGAVARSPLKTRANSFATISIQLRLRASFTILGAPSSISGTAFHATSV